MWTTEAMTDKTHSKPILLVLDLDETLIYGAETPLDREADFMCGDFSMYKRPGLDEFLASVFDRFEIGVWTSASDSYADCVTASLFTSDQQTSFVWGASRCTQRRDIDTHESYWVKDFKKLKRRGYELERVLVIDDTPQKHSRNYGNLIRIPAFEGDPLDDVLPKLSRYLRSLESESDVRAIEKRGWLSQVEE